MKITILILCAMLLLSPNYSALQAKAQSDVQVRAEQIFQDSEGNTVWGFDFVNAQTLLVALKDGRLLIVDLQDNTRKQINIPEVTVAGQGGLLDVLYHPPTNYVFWTFAESREDSAFALLFGDNKITTLARGTYTDGDIKDINIIFRSQVVGSGGRHFGSRLVIKDKHLFMTIGDRGERDNAQDLSNHNGTILRLTFDGKAAANNPFANKGLPEIYSYGHRNPQGIDIHPQSGKIYSNEFGPRGGDELNLIQSGKNYGWPIITYGKEYWGPSIGPEAKEGMEQPLTYWVPSISPSGMVFYRGDKIAQWTGDIFMAALGTQHLRRIQIKDDKIISQQVLFDTLRERIRQVRNSPDGYLYFSTDSGKIFRVLPM